MGEAVAGGDEVDDGRERLIVRTHQDLRPRFRNQPARSTPGTPHLESKARGVRATGEPLWMASTGRAVVPRAASCSSTVPRWSSELRRVANWPRLPAASSLHRSPHPASPLTNRPRPSQHRIEPTDVACPLASSSAMDRRARTPHIGVPPMFSAEVCCGRGREGGGGLARCPANPTQVQSPISTDKSLRRRIEFRRYGMSFLFSGSAHGCHARDYLKMITQFHFQTIDSGS